MAKSAVIIWFCLIFFAEAAFPRLQFSELSDLPMLFEHFQKHKLESPEISFIGFLSLHYGDSDHVDQDPKNHHKLPFSKSHRYAAIHQIVQYPTVFCLTTTFKVLMKIEAVPYQETTIKSISLAIWQPPKI